MLIQKLLEETGRRFQEMGKRLQAANIPPMSDEEVVAEVKAVRAARRNTAN